MNPPTPEGRSTSSRVDTLGCSAGLPEWLTHIRALIGLIEAAHVAAIIYHPQPEYYPNKKRYHGNFGHAN